MWHFTTEPKRNIRSRIAAGINANNVIKRIKLIKFLKNLRLIHPGEDDTTSEEVVAQLWEPIGVETDVINANTSFGNEELVEQINRFNGPPGGGNDVQLSFAQHGIMPMGRL
jgi:hypothetical protein